MPLAQAMQLRPSPELVWRTVARHHAIGNGKVIVPVEPGEKIVVSIVSATQQCLAEPSASQCRHGGRADLSPIFGGVRGAPGLSPTHACPGYAAGMGVLLGILTALVKVDVAMRPSPAPLAFTFDGPV